LSTQDSTSMGSDCSYSKLEKDSEQDSEQTHAPSVPGRSFFNHSSYDLELAGEFTEGRDNRRRRRIAIFTTLACFFYVIFFQKAFYSAPCHSSLTVEDKVKRILSETPLIGSSSHPLP